MASYRDRECAPTVARASGARRTRSGFFGIFQQHNCSLGDEAEFPVEKRSDKDGGASTA